MDASFGTASVAVTTGGGCAWTGSANASWITVLSGATGSGNGVLSYSAAANSGAARTGTLTIAGQTFTINQAAGTGTCIAGTNSLDIDANSNTEALTDGLLIIRYMLGLRG
ncbi:MAG: BACON domain-containing protein, partial [Acidobacteriota bacterium]